jgi:hypothetical protein
MSRHPSHISGDAKITRAVRVDKYLLSSLWLKQKRLHEIVDEIKQEIERLKAL